MRTTISSPKIVSKHRKIPGDIHYHSATLATEIETQGTVGLANMQTTIRQFPERRNKFKLIISESESIWETHQRSSEHSLNKSFRNLPNGFRFVCPVLFPLHS